MFLDFNSPAHRTQVHRVHEMEQQMTTATKARRTLRSRLISLNNNAQHIAGMAIGRTVLRFTGLRFGKEHRGTRWFSTVSANLAADGHHLPLFMFR